MTRSSPETVHLVTDDELFKLAVEAWECLSSTPAQAVPEREIFWLVERIGHSQYVKDRSELPALTPDPWRAERFATERQAHDFWLRLKTLRDECKPVEHIFINKPSAAPAGEPQAPSMTPIPHVQRIEMVKHTDCPDFTDFYEVPAEPMWRLEIDGICADFATETHANNFRNAVIAELQYEAGMYKSLYEAAMARSSEVTTDQIEAAWHAYQNTGIDMLADSDDETKKCLVNGLKAALALSRPHRGEDQ